MPFLTADAYVYARGGGRGHATRGRLISSALSQQGWVTHIWSDAADTGAPDPEARGQLLVIDTFARGWRGEISKDFLRRFDRRVLIARYTRSPDWEWVNAHYDQVVFPYCESSQEWRADEMRALNVPTRYAGLMVRELRVAARHSCTGDELAELTVIDPERRLSDKSCQELTARASCAGYSVRFAPTFDRQLEISLKTLVVGAGYNLFYELLTANADVRFLPVRKRFDDQDRRCRRWGRGIYGAQELESWLRKHVADGASPSVRRYANEV